MKKVFTLIFIIALVVGGYFLYQVNTACCEALTAECLSCQEGVDFGTYCNENPETSGCPATGPRKQPTSRPVVEVEESVTPEEKSGLWTPAIQVNKETQLNEEFLKEKNVFCDLENQRIKFTFFNPSNKYWFLGKDFPLKPPVNTVQARILLNTIHANGPTKYLNGVKAFGPGETFLENCQNKERLRPKEDVTCIVELSPLKREVDDKPNEIRIDPAGTLDDTSFKFFC